MKINKFYIVIIMVLLFSSFALSGVVSADIIQIDTLNESPETGFNIEGKKLISYKGNASEITIPVQIETIAIGAFRDCTTLTDLYINRNCITIDANAFYGCTNLKNVTIPDNDSKLKTIGYMAFARCGTLRTINLPYTLETIEECAFLACSQLTAVTLPQSLKTIGRYAFLSCINIKMFTIPENVTYIGSGAFNYCIKTESINVNIENKYFSSQSGVLYNKSRDTLIRYPAGKKNLDYSVISGTKVISQMAFWDNRYLITLTMPDSITSLENRSINDLSENRMLSLLIMPANSQNTIKEEAIKHCPNLTIEYGE